MQPAHCFLCHAALSPAATVCPSCHLLLVVQGRFALREYVNQGGFGRVYKAIDLQNPGAVCAVKVVPYESQDQYDQALREVDILQRHKLPFMPYFYTMQLHDESVYIVTEYINGNTLNTYQRGFWQPNRVERLVLVLLGYLVDLHAGAIVHRDLSPANIVRTPDHDYVLLDFGIAKEGTSTISAMRRAGNPGYAAPEQVLGTGTTPASDLYSLGATAYSLLTGNMPPTADRLAGTQLARPSALVPNVSPLLDDLLVWLLELDPDDRPSSAAAARAWADRYYDPPPAPARSRAAIWLAGLIFIVGLVAVIVFLGSVRGNAAPAAADPGRVVFTSSRSGVYELYLADGPDAPAAPLAALEGEEFAPAWSPDGRQVVYVRLLDGNYDIYRVGVDGSDNQPVAASPATEATPAWAPGGERVAFSSDFATGNFELYTIATNGVGGWTPLTQNPGVDLSPVWVSDEELLYISQRGAAWGIYRLSLDESREALVFAGQGRLFTLARSPDGARLAFGMADQAGNVDIYTVAADGSDLRQLTSHPAEDAYPSWSPDGARLTFQSKRDDTGEENAGQLYVIGANGGGEARASQGSIDDRQPAWGPGGP